ncbi:hypothetical protein MUK42_00132 [Musa troglodytarum]|uniref:Uncharacterized protein n=1 Tax=Musa troglodytarum TaxID=320322 RepID=A0A9E7FH23_9LILI|nr:hypothetical protein MUK42_00132 [Musa troglodytarum]
MESRTLKPHFHAAPPPPPSLWSVRISSVFGFSHRIEDHQIGWYLRRVISFKLRGVARYISWEVNELNVLRVGRRQLPWASHIRVEGANASVRYLELPDSVIAFSNKLSRCMTLLEDRALLQTQVHPTGVYFRGHIRLGQFPLMMTTFHWLNTWVFQ